MLKLFCLPILLSIGTTLEAQTYSQVMESFRSEYKQGFLEEENSPLKKSELKYLDFFDADSSYVITAVFKRTSDAIPFEMPTSSGKLKQYVKYGNADFNFGDTTLTLSIYQSITLRETEAFKDYLFIPFNDETNSETTYGGGRYIDLEISEIRDNNVIIDFNKAYNPYCAYSDGYSCPVPPQENKLPVRIEAGEKNYRKKMKD